MRRKRAIDSTQRHLVCESPATIERIDRVYILRDDLLGIGSKTRFVPSLIKAHPHIRSWVYGSCPTAGWAQVSLAHVCAQYGKEFHVFMADRREMTPLQKFAESKGATFHWVEHGRLTVTEARAREYAHQSDDRALIPIGVDDPVIVQAIADFARSLPIRPTETWIASASGTLSRGLQKAWPGIQHNFVMVGHKPTREQLADAILWQCPEPFNKPAVHPPPYPSVATFDAKLWQFIEYAKEDALIWNVAADIDEWPLQEQAGGKPTMRRNPLLTKIEPNEMERPSTWHIDLLDGSLEHEPAADNEGTFEFGVRPSAAAKPQGDRFPRYSADEVVDNAYAWYRQNGFPYRRAECRHDRCVR